MSFRLEVDHERADLKLAFLERFIPEIARRWISQGSAIVEATLITEIPERTGTLRRSVRRDVSETRAEIYTTAGYGKYVDQGTPPHVIRAKSGFLRFEIGGQVFFRKQVFHPGYAGRFFVHRTLAKVHQSLVALAESLFRDMSGGGMPQW